MISEAIQVYLRGKLNVCVVVSTKVYIISYVQLSFYKLIKYQNKNKYWL